MTTVSAHTAPPAVTGTGGHPGDERAGALAPQEEAVAERAARLMRRRSRATWVSVVLGALALIALLVATELVLAALGRPPLTVTPATMLDRLTGGGTVSIFIAGVAAAAGILCLWGSIAPGSTHRRRVTGRAAPMVVDDGLVAGAISRTAGRSADVSADQVETRVSARRAQVRVTPATGFAVDGDEVAEDVRALLARLRLDPDPDVRVSVDDAGRLS